MRDMNNNFLAGLIVVLVCGFGVSTNANAQAHKARASFASGTVAQQSLYTEYKGVRLGMTAEEARARLGSPMLKADDGDYYIFSDKETGQIVYDVAHKVVTISVDYTDGIGAPNYKTVVAGELEPLHGGLYKMMRYESQGFWVSYNRSAGPVVVVTITIQKMP